jgi:hypothetical protein
MRLAAFIIAVSLCSGAFGFRKLLETLTQPPSESFMSELRAALVTNDFSHLQNKNLSTKTRAFLRMLELQLLAPAQEMDTGEDSEGNEKVIRKRFAIRSAFLEELTALALIFFAPKVDLSKFQELLEEFEVRLTSETLAQFLPILPRNTIPNLTFSVDTNSRPKWRLHSCRDVNDRSRSCLRLRLSLNVNGKPLVCWAAVEFYFRNTNHFVRPMVTGFYLEKSEVPYDPAFFHFESLVDFAERSLEMARGGINFTLAQIYREYIQTLTAFCRKLQMTQNEEMYFIDLEMWI